jgi:hypothetical protein
MNGNWKKKAVSVLLAAFICVSGSISALAVGDGASASTSSQTGAEVFESIVPSFEDALAAAGTPTDSGENWQWFEDTKTLFLTADTGDFTSSSAKPWDAYENAVETVYSSGVTGKYAFYKAPKLKEVYAYGSVMAYSYGYCDALTDIYVVNAEVIDKSAFAVCDALANVTIENAGAIGASSFTRKGLQKVVINGYDSIGEWAFQLGTGSQKAPLEVSITGDGTIGGGVFAGRELGDVTITGGKTESFFEEYKGDIYETSTFYDVFWDPDATLTLNGVTLSDGCFSQGNAPASFVATDCVVGNDAFANAYSAPQNVTLVNCEVGSGAFSCYNDTYSLQSVSITGGSVGKSAFSDCNGLTELTLQDVESIDGYAFYNTGITSLHIQGEGTQIGNAAFCYNDNLKSVILDGNMTVEQRAFVGCPMETLEFRNCTKIDGSFGESVQDTTTIILPDTIESISSSAFTNCKCLQGTLDLTGVKTIGYNAFTGCTNITELIVDDDAQLAYSDIFPDTVANWEQRVEAILSGKFLLDAANAITQIASDGWTSAKTGENNGLNYGDTQLVKEAKWDDMDETIADVQIKAYYTAEKQMDFVFVLDCTNSMSAVGNPSQDQYAKFYDMQSKLLDVTSELLSAGDAYDCKVAFTGYGAKAGSQQFTSGKFFGKDELAEAEDFIYNVPNYRSLTNISLGLKEALTLVQSNKEAGRATTVILISDGTPNKNGSFTGLEDGYYGYDEAQAIRSEGAEIYGVLHAMTGGNVDDRAREVMATICGGDSNYFVSYDTEGFSEAVNDAIVAVYGEYVLTDVVDPAFELNEDSILASAGDVAISQDENGNTVLTWTISGMPFTVHTLSFQENLKQVDGEYPYGLFDTNEGDATLELFGDPVNTVPTPQLPRETEEIPDESTPLNPPTSDPGDGSGPEEIPDESTPLAPPTGEGTSPVWILAGVALLALFGSAATLCKKKESCKR